MFMVLTNVMRQGAVLAQGMILSRLLTMSDLGSFRQVIMITNLAYAFTYLALPESASFFLASLDAKKQRIFTFQTIAMSCGLGLFAAVSLWAGAPFLAHRFNNAELTQLLILGATIPFCITIKTLLTVSFVTVGRARLSSLISVVFAILNVISIIVPVALGATLQQAMYPYVALHILTMVVSLVYIWKIIGLEFAFDGAMLRRQLAFSVPFWVGYAVFFGYGQAHKFIVGEFFSPEEFALFSNGSTEVPVIAQLSVVIALPLVPASVKLLQTGTPAQVVDLWSKSAAKVAIVSVPVFMLCVFSPKMILSLLFGSKYADAWPIFVVCSALMVLRTSNVQSLFKVIGKTHYTLVSSAVALVVGLGSGILLLFPLKLLGPVVGIVLARISELAVALHYIRKHLPVTLVKILALPVMARVAMAAAFACACAKLVTFGIAQPWVYVPVNATLAGVIYLVIVLRIGVLSPGDKAMIVRWATLAPFRN